MNWSLRLQDYDFEIIHKNGQQNKNADALSRIKINALGSNDDVESMEVNIDENELKDRSKLAAEKNRVRKDSTSDKSRTLTASPFSDKLSRYGSDHEQVPVPSESNKSETIHSHVELESVGIPILHEAVDTKPNQILVYSWAKNELNVKDLSRDKQKVLEIFLPLNNSDLAKEFLKRYIKPKVKYFIYFEELEHCRLFGNLIIQLFKNGMVNFYECTERVLYIEDEREQRAVTVAAVINACEVCQKMKYDRKPIKPVLQLTQTHNAPFQEIFIVLFSIEGKSYLTLIDAFSKLGHAIEIQGRSTPEVVRALMSYFSYYGTPKKISSDPGSEFNNMLIK